MININPQHPTRPPQSKPRFRWTVVAIPSGRQYFVRGAGILSIAYGATINGAVVADGGTEYAGGLANGADFDGAAAATLILDDPSLFAGTIVNFGSGDRIDFRNVTSASIDGTGHLNMTTTAGNYSWALLGQHAAAEFTPTSDGVGGTVLVYQPVDMTHTISVVIEA
ncbi:hypothetical protein ACKWRH_00650 [Bradyrhizobium sp. Pa8]|uniref:hypothetical protein n=1 Tax=Bradyrhizobium sp. Pa8 TaxID=3386552 RepID=UPI00403F02C2